MTRDIVPVGSSPIEPLDGDEAWLGGIPVAVDEALREAGDEPR